jgi:D-alanyl-D-alanine carboxypeptidase/D-alanyl-D-alanine-endopeptidase (penicillin-binding protein 4)
MKQWFALILLLVGACVAAPQKSSDGPSESNASSNVTEKGICSAFAVDLESGETIIDLHGHLRMTPASLTKILTTGAALHRLGADFRYETSFCIQSNSADKTLLVIGSGDPTLGSERFEDTKPTALFGHLLAALKQKGIKSLSELVVDNSCFAGVRYPSKRLWEDMGNYYGAVPNGLSYRENTFFLTLQSPQGIGKPVRVIKTDPPLTIRINSQVTTAANGKDSAYIYGNEWMNEWYVSGTIPQGRSSFVIKGALPHPEQVFANELKQFLAANGIRIGQVTYRELTQPEYGEVVYRHLSPSLKEIIAVINKRSHNLYADHLMFTMAQQTGVADWDGGVRLLTAFWQKHIPDFSAGLFDGSGLSPFNAFSAKDMVDVLEWMNQTAEKEAFEESLSVGGVDGTLKSIFKEPEYKGRLLGKSGSINGVLGYCGYLTTSRGRKVAFCMMANRFAEPYAKVRTNMETLMMEIIDQN